MSVHILYSFQTPRQSFLSFRKYKLSVSNDKNKEFLFHSWKPAVCWYPEKIVCRHGKHYCYVKNRPFDYETHLNIRNEEFIYLFLIAPCSSYQPLYYVSVTSEYSHGCSPLLIRVFI